MNDAGSEDDGRVAFEDGRYVLRFERRFAQPPRRVWEALTDPEQMKQWLSASEIEVDLVEGGHIYTRTTEPELIDAVLTEHPELDGPEMRERGFESTNVVLRLDPPRLLEHTFGAPDSIVRWEIQPDGDGCRLLLTHIEPPGFSAKEGPRDMAGWHHLLEQMAKLLGGDRDVRWSRARWQEIVRHYRRVP